VSVRPSVCLSRRSTAAAACDWFAAESEREQQILIDSCGRRVPAVGRYLLQAPVLSSKRGQRSVESRGTRLNTDLLELKSHTRQQLIVCLAGETLVCPRWECTLAPPGEYDCLSWAAAAMRSVATITLAHPVRDYSAAAGAPQLVQPYKYGLVTGTVLGQNIHGGWGCISSPQWGSVAEPRRKSNFVHFSLKI